MSLLWLKVYSRFVWIWIWTIFNFLESHAKKSNNLSDWSDKQNLLCWIKFMFFSYAKRKVRTNQDFPILKEVIYSLLISWLLLYKCVPYIFEVFFFLFLFFIFYMHQMQSFNYLVVSSTFTAIIKRNIPASLKILWNAFLSRFSSKVLHWPRLQKLYIL